jgi:3-hydroxyisobutyrate dehydrogenase-like beta-hydroxyacid dehydrogenase
VRVAVLGLGRMGVPIARRLMAAGHEVAVWNRSPGRADELLEGGATELASPAESWERADVAITMVLDDTALRTVTAGEGGLLAAPPAGRVLVDMSTVSVAASAEVAKAAEEAAVTFLRAPVSGNPSVVEAGNLGIMVSGDEAEFRRLESLLRDIGPNVFYLGPRDEARVMKLALQILITGTGQLLAEALVLGEANGLDRARMLEVMGASAVGSPFVKYKTGALVEADYKTTFSGTAAHKDLALVLDCADAVGVPAPVTALVQQLVLSCISSGLGDLDFMTLLPRLQRDAGLEPDVSAAASRP